VVFFRVVGSSRRRIRIKVDRILGDRFIPDAATEHWASPLLDSPGSEFGVLAPTNFSIWKLRVGIALELRRPIDRLLAMPYSWRILRVNGEPCLRAAWEAWGAFDFGESQIIESDAITNAIPRR
jgi:hypothetical protein